LIDSSIIDQSLHRLPPATSVSLHPMAVEPVWARASWPRPRGNSGLRRQRQKTLLLLLVIPAAMVIFCIYGADRLHSHLAAPLGISHKNGFRSMSSSYPLAAGSFIVAHSHQRRVAHSFSACTAVSGEIEETQLPRTSDEMVEQASAVVRAAVEDGKRRHRLDFILPINEKKYDFLAIESMDYPCSLSEEFETAVRLGKQVLSNVAGSSETDITERRLDEGGVEGDPSMLLRLGMVSVIAFPFADNLDAIRREAEMDGGKRTIILLNPQWNDQGQVVSDFGFGPWKKRAEDFLATFETSFTLAEQRIGAPSSLSLQDGKRYSDGGVVRVLRKYPSPHVAFVMAVDGASQAIGSFLEFPSYKELEVAIQEGREKNLEIFDYAKDAVMPNPFAQSNLDASSASINDVGSLLESMDKTAIRQALEKRGLPTSGTMATIRDRLRDAIENERPEEGSAS